MIRRVLKPAKPVPPVLYFAYGSNLDGEQMRTRCPSARRVSTAVLRGVSIAFDGHSVSRGGPVATLVETPKGETPGLVYEVSAEDMSKLDRHEGAPTFYRRVTCSVELPSGKSREVHTYVLARAMTRRAPAKDYYRIIADAYKRLGFNKGPLVAAARKR